MYKQSYCDFSDLEGFTFQHVSRCDDAIYFYINDYDYFVLKHIQECSEYVSIKDLNGDISDLVGTPIINAYEKTNFNDNNSSYERWTFYTVQTQKGTVDISFFGESNGYYSVGVDLICYICYQ